MSHEDNETQVPEDCIMVITAGRSPRKDTAEVSYFVLHQPRSSCAAEVLRAKHKVDYQMSQYLYSSRLTTCLPKVTSELSSHKETTLGNWALRQSGATFACFRVGKVSLMISSLSTICRIYRCIPDSAQEMSVGINTDSATLRFFSL